MSRHRRRTAAEASPRGRSNQEDFVEALRGHLRSLMDCVESWGGGRPSRRGVQREDSPPRSGPLTRGRARRAEAERREVSRSPQSGQLELRDSSESRNSGASVEQSEEEEESSPRVATRRGSTQNRRTTRTTGNGRRARATRKADMGTSRAQEHRRDESSSSVRGAGNQHRGRLQDNDSSYKTDGDSLDSDSDFDERELEDREYERMRKIACTKIAGLPDFDTLTLDYESFESYFLAFEDAMRGKGVKGRLLFEALRTQLSRLAISRYIRPYLRDGGAPRYAALRDHILGTLGVRRPGAYYLSKIAAAKEMKLKPRDLSTYLCDLHMQYCRAIKRSGEDKLINESVLAQHLFESLPSDCQKWVATQLPYVESVSAVMTEVSRWEQLEQLGFRSRGAKRRSPVTVLELLREKQKKLRDGSEEGASEEEQRQNRAPFVKRDPSSHYSPRPQIKHEERGGNSSRSSNSERAGSRHSRAERVVRSSRMLSAEERQERWSKGLCLKCGKAGHIARNCQYGFSRDQQRGGRPTGHDNRGPRPTAAATACVGARSARLSLDSATPSRRVVMQTTSTHTHPESVSVAAGSQERGDERAGVQGTPAAVAPVRADPGNKLQEVQAEAARASRSRSRSESSDFWNDDFIWGRTAKPVQARANDSPGAEQGRAAGESAVGPVCEVPGAVLWHAGDGDGSRAVETQWEPLLANVLIDTGAQVNVLAREAIPEGYPILPPDATVTLRGADSKPLRAEGLVRVTVVLGPVSYTGQFFITTAPLVPVLLGTPFLRDTGITVDCKRECMSLPGHPEKIPFVGSAASKRVCYPVKDVTVPANTAMAVQVALAGVSETGRVPGEFYVHKTWHPCGVVVPHTLSAGFVEVANWGDRAVRIPAGFPLARYGTGRRKTLLTVRAAIAAGDATQVSRNGDSSRGQKERQQEEVELDEKALESLPDFTEAEKILTSEQVKELKKLCWEYRDIFRSSHQNLTHTTLCEAPLELEPPGIVISKPPHRQSREQRLTTQKIVKDLLENNIISTSTSPWSAPVTLVKKKDGSPRFCVDYRALNECLKVPSYPLPRIDDVLQCFEGKFYFSVMDLVAGFWQIPIPEKDRPKTAFVTPDGLFQWNRLPFGLASSPAYFQKMMDMVIAGLKWRCAIAYIDDLIVYSTTFEEHLRDLRAVFAVLRAAVLKLHPRKCVLAVARVEYLGYVVSREGLQPNPKKVKAVAEFPVPSNVTELRRFLGLAQYYRKFVRDFSARAAPLFQLLKKNAPFVWSVEVQAAFEDLKRTLCDSPILKHPDLNKPFIIECDASSAGLGAALLQADQEGVERVIAYASRTLTPHQTKWCAMELEAAAVLFALETFRTYIAGTKVTVRTDHSPLTWLKQRRETSAKMTRWLLKLQEYNLDVQHKPGKKMFIADALSRAPVDTEEEPVSLDVFPDRATLAVRVQVASCQLRVHPSAVCLRAPYLARPASSPYTRLFVHHVKCLRAMQNPWRQEDSPTYGTRRQLEGEGKRICLATKHASVSVARVAPAGPADGEESHAEEISVQELLERERLPKAPDLRTSDLRKEQASDVVCRMAREVLEGRRGAQELKWLKEGELREQEGVLCVQFSSSKKKGPWRIIVPESLRCTVLQAYHLSYYGGHHGRAKTLRRIAQRYFWPGMTKSVETYIAKCMFCLTYKPCNRRPDWLVLPTGAPFEIVAMDLYGPLPASLRRKQYVLVIIDHHTRWCELVALNKIRVNDIAAALQEHWFCRFGVPRVLLSDNGPQFKAELMTRLSEAYGIQKVFSSPYYPQGNSIVETFMRTLHLGLMTAYDIGLRRWDELLPAIAMAYRATPHLSTGCSPFFLVTGTEMVLPLSREWEEPGLYDRHDQWLQALWEYRHRLIEANTKLIERRRAALKPGSDIPVGAWVGVNSNAFFTQAGQSSKFTPAFIGPFRVLRKLDNGVTYELEDVATGGKRKVNRKLIKVFDDPSEEPPQRLTLPRKLLGVPEPERKRGRPAE